MLTDPDIDNVPFRPDVSYLNSDITSDEVRKAVFRSKLNKSVGVDEIPSELLRNDHCIDLLHKIINYCFTKSEVPQEWVKSVITPVPKPNMDPYNPLSYRPYVLIRPAQTNIKYLQTKTQHSYRNASRHAEQPNIYSEYMCTCA